LSSRKTKDDNIRQSQLATANGVSEVTVRNRMKELLKEVKVNSLLSQYGLVIVILK
jgi:transcription initiation factor TFIIIB Brf1 subunit/transcription initiation factor TFIIB